MKEKIMFLFLFLVSSPLFALDLPATLAWSQRVEIGTLVSGEIEQVAVVAGQKVQQGDLLVKLDESLFRAQVSSARALSVQSQALFEEAKREHERTQELYDRTLLSEHELQLVHIARVEAEAALQKARTRLTRAELDLARCTLQAPFSGVVLAVNASPRQAVNNRLTVQPLVTVAQYEPMLAASAVDSKLASALSAGKPVSVAVQGVWEKGVVHRVAMEPSSTDEKGTYYTLEVSFPAGDRILRAGEPATIRLEQ